MKISINLNDEQRRILNGSLSIMRCSRNEAMETIQEIKERNPEPSFKNLFITREKGFENWIQDIEKQLDENLKMELGEMVNYLNDEFDQDHQFNFEINPQSEIIDLETFLSFYFDQENHVIRKLTA